ncbi:MAG: IclR family transcriptional regulator [Candidatus Rokubacteria bacterium]|nr:IclR family transcriptional regulator [Candidatus Rokubacteria bacterium]
MQNGRSRYRPTASSGKARGLPRASGRRPAEAGGERSRVPAIDGAVRVLRCLATRGEGVGVTEIGRACHLSKSTAHGIVKALEAHGFVVTVEPSKRYVLGAGLVRLAEAARSQRTAVLLARPPLEEVARQTRLGCFLAAPYGATEFLVLEKAESSRAVKVTVSVGERFPLTAGALGKAYLAWLPDAEIRETLRRVPLPRMTPRSIRSTRQYLAELERVRRQGFGANYDEYYAGTHALAAPVFDPSGRIVLLLLTVGFAADLPAARMTTDGRLLRAAADRVTEALGGHPPKLQETGGGAEPASGEKKGP